MLYRNHNIVEGPAAQHTTAAGLVRVCSLRARLLAASALASVTGFLSCWVRVVSLDVTSRLYRVWARPEPAFWSVCWAPLPDLRLCAGWLVFLSAATLAPPVSPAPGPGGTETLGVRLSRTSLRSQHLPCAAWVLLFCRHRIILTRNLWKTSSPFLPTQNHIWGTAV